MGKAGSIIRRVPMDLVLPATFILSSCTSLPGGRAPFTNPIEARTDALVLQQHGIAPDSSGVLGLLRKWKPDAPVQAELASLIRQLGSDKYEARQQASRQIRAWGAVALDPLLPPLQAAARSSDPEVAWQAAELLRGWQPAEQRQLNVRLLRAALHWLRQSPAAPAAPVLLEILPSLPDAHTRQTAYEALWACAAPGHADRFREALGQSDPVVRAAAIPALELAAGAKSVGVLRRFLADRDEAVRLSAARALMDRLPRASLAALCELVGSTDAGIRSQAAWLLQQASGRPRPEEPAVEFTVVLQRWTAWAQGPEADHPMPLGRKRHQVARYGTIVSELFADHAADARQGYHQFDYESSAEGGAFVSGGMLRLEGDGAEGDQRLYLTAEKLLGRPAFPGRFQIETHMGGEERGSGGWHVGVSVGNIRLLFHPAYAGGGFRAECVSDHKPLLENQTMPFTPAADVLHEVTIDVQCLESGDVRLDICIADGALSGKRFTHTVTAKREDIGALQRIGLERSGRAGGAALFGSLVVGL